MHRILEILVLTGCALPLASCAGDGNGTTAPPPDTAVATITLSSNMLGILVGQTEQLTATMRNQAGRLLVGPVAQWTISDAGVASVSTTGLVRGEGGGTATVTATSAGKFATATVNVTALAALAFASVATGGAHTCALTASGAAYCWGRGESGQLGTSASTNTCTIDGQAFPCKLTPAPVRGGIAFTQLAAGVAHTCGLTSDGSPYCWGDNAVGQLGDNSATMREQPTAVATTLKFSSIDAGAYHTCAVTGSAAAYCWGRNDRGQLGDGSTTTRRVPTAVSGNHAFQFVSAGGFSVGHTCGLRTDGKAYCWGDNERGQLGNAAADVTAHPLPVAVSGAQTFTALQVGLGRHSCALDHSVPSGKGGSRSICGPSIRFAPTFAAG